MTERDIFISALQKEGPAQRQAYLDEVCADDPELRARVEELLRLEENAGSFLERQPVPEATGVFTPSPGDELPGVLEGPGTRIGSYRLLEQIGAGGFGVVYMAEQLEPIRRKVALKVLKPGMDSAQVVARFEAERQALALMDHPNIARVFDGGTTETGRPYFVMELVKGIPITELCDQEKRTTRERLELFVEVCAAVQHAHQKGVIHRDIKPSNVLVTLHDGKPVVKVIDFGIAKALGQQLTERTLFTGFAQMIGTPLYMSPEQAALSGLDVDTRSDVYSLGVLLYELLTGTTPFDAERLRRAGYDEMRRIIRDEEPPRPSMRLSTLGEKATPISAQRGSNPVRLSQIIRGELDWIVMKALEKDRNRRYESPSAFAADVRRYLNDEPVLACPPRVGYRVRKFVRRNKGPVLVVSAIVLLLAGGIAGTTAGLVQAVTARDQKDVALQNEKEARQSETEARQQEKDAWQKEKEARQREAEAWKKEAQAQEKEKAALQREIAERTEKEKALERFVRLLRGSWLSETLTHWRERNVAAARDKLDELREIVLKEEQKPEDTWEHRYLDHLMNNCGQHTFRGHTGGVTSVAFSPDGKRIASSGGTEVRMVPGQVAVRDAATGQILLTLRGHTAGVTSVAYGPDGKLIATASGESGRSGQVKMWDAATGKELWNDVKGHKGLVHCVAFSPDGRYLASGSDDWTVKLWDPRIGKVVRSIIPGEGRNHVAVMSVAFSPDGRHLASVGGPETVTVWETATGKEVWTVQGKGLFPPNRSLFSVAFSPDSRKLAAGSEDRTVKVWDAMTGQPFPPLQGHLQPVNGVAFSPDGRHLASASRDGMVKLWDAATGQEVATFLGHTFLVSGVAFSPDGRRLASASHDGTVKVWNYAEGPGDRILRGHRGLVTSVAFSPDGRKLASADAAGALPGEVKVWDAVTGEGLLTLRGHTGEVNGVAFSPNGKHIASASGMVGRPGEVKVWDAEGKLLHTLEGHGREVMRVAFGADGKYLASASPDQTVKLWDPETGKLLRTLRGHTGFVTGLAFSADGKRLASGGTDRTVKLWDPETGKVVQTFKGHANVVFALAFSPDGKRLASASADRTVKVWDTATGQPLLTLRGHFEMVLGVAFSPDGLRLASGGMDGTTRLWDATTGQELLTFKEYTGWVTSVAFSPDGTQLASAIGDRTVKVRQAPKGLPVRILRGHNDQVMSLVFSPDGKRLASGSKDALVKLWDVATGQELLSLPEHEQGVWSVAFSADGKRLVTEDNRLVKRTWDAATGKPVVGPAEKTVPGAPLSPDGRLLAVAEGKRIHLYRLPDGKEPEPAGWRWWIDPAPWWHAGQASLAEQRKDWFAAAFHRGQLAATAEASRFGQAASNAYRAACYLGRCAALVEKDAKLDKAQRKQLARSHADRALVLLRQAVARGYKSAADLKMNPDLEPLRGRDEFRKLIAELESKAKE